MIYKLKKSGLVLFSLLLVVFLSSCETAEILRYKHEQSEKFYKDLNYFDKELNAFKVDNILFVIRIKAIDYSTYRIWLGTYSDQSDSKVNIRDALLKSDDWQLQEPINKTLILSNLIADKSLYEFNDGLMLMDVEGLEIGGGLDSSNDIELIISYEINGVAGSMRFDIDRVIEKQTVFPT